MSENAMSWYYSVRLVNVKAILHSAVIVKIIFHPHMINRTRKRQINSLYLFSFPLSNLLRIFPRPRLSIPPPFHAYLLAVGQIRSTR